MTKTIHLVINIWVIQNLDLVGHRENKFRILLDFGKKEVWPKRYIRYVYMNSNILKTNFFYEMKYDFKGQWRSTFSMMSSIRKKNIFDHILHVRIYIFLVIKLFTYNWMVKRNTIDNILTWFKMLLIVLLDFKILSGFKCEGNRLSTTTKWYYMYHCILCIWIENRKHLWMFF